MKMRTSDGISALSPRRGFTLVEVLVSSAILTLVVIGALSGYLYGLNTYSYDLGRSFVNRDYRNFMNDMSSTVTYCNQIRTYTAFNDRTAHVDTNGNFSGNLVLCIYETLQTDGTNNITRIVGYYQGTDGAKTPIRSFTVNTNVDAHTDVLTLIPATSAMNSSSHPIEYPDCVGLNPGAKVFRDFMNNGTGVMVHAQLRNPGSLMKKATNSIHFTVVRRS